MEETEKPGYLTTEFWVNIFTQVVGTVISVASLFGHSLDGSKFQPLIGMAAMIAMGISAAYYAHGRSNVKAAKVNATAVIAAMPTPVLPSDPSAVPSDIGVDPSADVPDGSSVDPGSEAAQSMAQMGTAA